MSSTVAHFGRNRRPYAIGLLMGLAVAAVALVRSGIAVELKEPQANDRYVAMAVTKMLTTKHLTSHPMDAEMSRRCFDEFLKTLDPYKLYFMQSDYDQFKASQDDLCEKIRHGNIDFAYQVFRTLLKRVDERMQLVDQLLAESNKFDFTTDDQYVTDPKLTTYAATADEMRDKWVKRIKYDLLVQEAEEIHEKAEAAKEAAHKSSADGNGTSSSSSDAGHAATPEVEKTPREKLDRRYHSYARRMHQIDNDELLELYLTALTSSFDPHTSYMSASTLENFNIMMRAELDGICASLQDKDGVCTVSELVPGGAAELEGHLQPKDRVIAVCQGESGEFVDVVDMSLNDVVKLIRGKRGTVVRLKVIPVGKNGPQIYNITRAKIELKNSEARGEILEDGKKEDGQPYRIGFIDLPGFYMDMDGAHERSPDYKSATRDVHRILDDFNEKHVDAVIIDLRRNGGGALNEAISLTGLFIDTGPVVQVKGPPDGQVHTYDDEDPGVAWKGPLVVLQSKFSASASEIFAGAIQDYHRGLVVGDHSSHGKGTVQSMLDVGKSLLPFIPNAPQLGALKLTIQQFYRPDGDSTQQRGVLSDVELPSLSTYLPVGEGDLDYSLKFDHVEPATFTPVNMIDADLVKQLRDLSAERVEKSADFKRVAADIARYQKRKDRKQVSLNRDKFLADYADMDADHEEEKQFDEPKQGKHAVVKRDYYVNEVLGVTEDLVHLSKVKELALTN